MPQIVANLEARADGTYRSYVDEGTPLAFTIETYDSFIYASLDRGVRGYWIWRRCGKTDGREWANMISDASCLAMVLDAVHRGLKVTTSEPWKDKS